MPSGREEQSAVRFNAQLQAAQGWAGLGQGPGEAEWHRELANESAAQPKLWIWSFSPRQEAKVGPESARSPGTGLVNWAQVWRRRALHASERTRFLTPFFLLTGSF